MSGKPMDLIYAKVLTATKLQHSHYYWMFYG